ncbi:tyrosine-type recombinase/integrase [Roseiconus lacunae]|uniref:Tyrosine-type recombinase/integrase n=1 Tax=Roseiconus lacunae TaxID=2605694 RepID=A0ABT7PEG9_9BACT|nr:tyrosine-type recombinase/integrase [Roseiconus lacunae]MDM4014889.1 tyrosine-type recombinase/integrase [Roseiconus lacunae]
MAFLFRPTYKDKTGKTKKTRKWYAGGIVGPDGKKRRVPLCADKTAAQAMLADLLRDADRIAAGVGKPTPVPTLAKAIAGWEQSLRAKCAGETHVGIATSRVRRVFSNCETIRQISSSVMEKVLAELAEEGSSIQTRNHYLASAKAFANWLVNEELLPTNPLARLRKSNAKKDVRRERRVLTDEEFATVLSVTAKSTDTIRGLAGPDRRMLYITAAATGFRASELARLKPGAFLLDGDEPAVFGKAAYAKGGKHATQPLPPAVVVPLREYLADKPDAQPVWTGDWRRKAAKLIKHDLAAASIAYKTDEGYADFHALRHLYITGLFRAGVHPKVAQALARHSTIQLTMETYTKVADEELRRGVAKLRFPPLGEQ